MAQNPTTIILRADASTAMGTGHVMRCFALAQSWQDAGGRPVFAIAEAAPAIRERLLADDMEVVPLEISAGGEDDAATVTELAQRYSARWVVVDGYQFGADYQRQLKVAGLKVLFVDDNGHAGHYSADLVLNQNAHAHEGLYESREPYTRLLLGSRYAMLRREFARWHGWKREIAPVARKVLVTMGGSDPDNITIRVIEALSQIAFEGLETVVVVGGGNPHVKSLEQMASKCGRSLQLKKDTANIAQLMAWADMALVAAGGTLWELLFMGCPVLSYARSPIQAKIVSELAREGLVRNLGHPRDSDPHSLSTAITDLAKHPECRRQMSALGQERIDGKGSSRICEQLITPAAGNLPR